MTNKQCRHYNEAINFPEVQTLMTKALISVTGLDTTGIIASVATRLSEMNINILDISQTILDGYFTMMMVVVMLSRTADMTNDSEHMIHSRCFLLLALIFSVMNENPP